MRQKILIIALVVSVALNVGALVTFAYRCATTPKPPEPPGRLAQELGLTDEQREMMREQREKSCREMEPLRREMDRKRGEVLALLKKPEVDVARRDQLFAEIADLQMRMELLTFENMCETKSMLRPEQQERFIAHVEERFQHQHEHFKRGPAHGPGGHKFEPRMMRERSGEGR
ncbi:MAG TPA: Spy/CpxP family protein refolding chaperone [bacterium]|nr:Spy/CpxP family protein refolding chaperone [bacterium]